MYRRRPRSGRRSDGLYQARLHQRIQERIEEAETSRKPLTYAELSARAEEARVHGCDHTFIHPEMLLHLLELRERYLKLRSLVEDHWGQAQKDQEAGHDDRDLYLWTQALGWLERQDE